MKTLPLQPERVDRAIFNPKGRRTVVDARTVPMYPAAEAARIIGVPAATLRSWFPPFQRNSLTFLQLAEAYMIQLLRKKHGMRMRRINKSREFLREKTGHKYPFAVENLGLETDGKGIFYDDAGCFASASEQGQLAMRVLLERYLDRLEYGADGLALRLYPFTEGSDNRSTKLVIIDPRLNFGRPCLAKNAVSTLMIARRANAGESRAEIADDYNCTVAEIDEAIHQETARTAAA